MCAECFFDRAFDLGLEMVGCGVGAVLDCSRGGGASCNVSDESIILEQQFGASDN